MSFIQIVLAYVFFVATGGLFSFLFVMIWRSLWKEKLPTGR